MRTRIFQAIILILIPKREEDLFYIAATAWRTVHVEALASCPAQLESSPTHLQQYNDKGELKKKGHKLLYILHW